MTRTVRFQRQLAVLMAASLILSLFAAAWATPKPPEAMQLQEEAPPEEYGGTVSSRLPPVRFQQLEGITVAVVVYAPPAAIPRICQKYGTAPSQPGYETKGCATERDGHAIIVQPNSCLDPGAYMSPAWVSCHEIGHVNRWPGTHGQ